MIVCYTKVVKIWNSTYWTHKWECNVIGEKLVTSVLYIINEVGLSIYIYLALGTKRYSKKVFSSRGFSWQALGELNALEARMGT